MNILIIEDDLTSQIMLQKILSAYTVTVAGSGEDGLESARQSTPDIVILDINLPGIDGYEVCRQLRASQETNTTPIIFLSSYQSLEDRLTAYGAGGNDYINKPFDVSELKLKVSQVQQQVEQHKAVNQNLHSSQQMVLGIMSSAAKIQSISRFIQASLFMHDMDTLIDCFFRVADEIELSCVLKMDSGTNTKVVSSNQEISQLEDEILQLSDKVARIHSFGKDRAIFRWKHATLLARNVDDMIDTIAIFMDALEAGIKSVLAEEKLMAQVEIIEKQNLESVDKMKQLFELMNEDIKTTILTLGFFNGLDAEDEERINGVLDLYSERIRQELLELNNNSELLRRLVTDLRTPPEGMNIMQEEVISAEAELF